MRKESSQGSTDERVAEWATDTHPAGPLGKREWSAPQNTPFVGCRTYRHMSSSSHLPEAFAFQHSAPHHGDQEEVLRQRSQVLRAGKGSSMGRRGGHSSVC